MLTGHGAGKIHSEAEPQRTGTVRNGLPFEKFAKVLMNGEAFVAYVKRNGYHFTPELADEVTARMINADGSKHHWTTKQVRETMEAKGMAENPHHATWGDAAVAANMAYADFYPSPIATELGCIQYAYKLVCDPDGYEGQIFARWLSDVVATEMEVEWEAY